mmetsp:Transcript_28009/g.65338  ORF Transcript_28009/g.65338 Transcript_28009/m.65338 type:complete len:318 (-) Transcript_28009:2640-3593(-)
MSTKSLVVAPLHLLPKLHNRLEISSTNLFAISKTLLLVCFHSSTPKPQHLSRVYASPTTVDRIRHERLVQLLLVRCRSPRKQNGDIGGNPENLVHPLLCCSHTKRRRARGCCVHIVLVTVIAIAVDSSFATVSALCTIIAVVCLRQRVIQLDTLLLGHLHETKPLLGVAEVVGVHEALVLALLDLEQRVNVLQAEQQVLVNCAKICLPAMCDAHLVVPHVRHAKNDVHRHHRRGVGPCERLPQPQMEALELRCAASAAKRAVVVVCVGEIELNVGVVRHTTLLDVGVPCVNDVPNVLAEERLLCLVVERVSVRVKDL